MKLKELINKLNELAEDNPSLLDDIVYYYDCLIPSVAEDISTIEVEFDTRAEGRYILIK